MISTYSEAIRYLYDNLPMYQRVGAAAFKKNITNTIALCEALGNPQSRFKSIHVAGTNGKGSSCHMLASILQEGGYKTGLYTSPHLKEFTERIKIDGFEVSQDFVISFVNRVQPLIQKLQPSFFEITVAMAFDYFALQRVDVAVVEVGLGGRLDSTNVITPVVSLITNIGWDHKNILGDTLEEIAAEKAGIIKYETPVVISERQDNIATVFVSKARAMDAPFFFASDDYKISTSAGRIDACKKNEVFMEDIKLQLGGVYQYKNLCGVLKTVEIIQASGFTLNLKNVRKGLEKVITNTGLKGRWQKINEKPLVICDTGHNVDGIREVMLQVRSIAWRKLHFVLGVVKDKDVAAVLSLLPKEAKYYFCQAQIPRALHAQELSEKAESFGLQGEVIPDVNEAKKKAIANAAPDDLVFIGGSTFVVAEIDEL